MTIRFATQEEIARWDQLIAANPDGGNILQSVEMANLKATQGWKPRYLMADKLAITVHERSVPGFGKLWYIPKGPGVITASELVKLKSPLEKFAADKGVFVIKVEAEVVDTTTNTAALRKNGFIKANTIQPNTYTVFVDLTPSIDDILTALPQKSRHAIKRAQRDGIRVERVETTDKNLSTMFHLMQQTMEGKAMFLRSETYYRTYWKSYSESGNGALFFAYNGKKPIAGAFVLLLGNKATYKDGGSTREKPIYGMSHALQWGVIEWLKTKNITSYDLCGTPPADKLGDPTHHFHGMGIFKTSFNKTVTEFVGVYDIPVRPAAHKVWSKIGERALKRFYAQVFKQYFY